MKFIVKILPAFIVIALTACFLEEENEPDKTAGSFADDEKALLQEAYQVPGELYLGSFDLIITAIEAVYYASAYSGSGKITSEGTVDLRGNPSYNPTPEDQLIVRRADGSIIFPFDEFSSELIAGDLRENIRQSHVLRFHVAKFGHYDLNVSSRLQNGYRKLSLTGQYEANGKTYSINFEANGDYYFNVDNTGSELLINDQYEGTINCEEWNAEIKETWYYNNVYSSSAGANAEYVTRTFNNNFRNNEAIYLFKNGRIQTVFRDGRPNEYDMANSPWMARGQLIKDGEEIGQLDWNVDGSFLKIYLVASGESLELQSWRIQ